VFGEAAQRQQQKKDQEQPSKKAVHHSSEKYSPKSIAQWKQHFTVSFLGGGPLPQATLYLTGESTDGTLEQVVCRKIRLKIRTYVAVVAVFSGLASCKINSLRVLNTPFGFDSHPRLHRIPNVYAGI